MSVGCEKKLHYSTRFEGLKSLAIDGLGVLSEDRISVIDNKSHLG